MLLKQAKIVAAQRLADAKGSDIFRSAPAGYTREPDSNLIPGVTRDDFWEDIESGDGSELKDTKRGPAKFCAAYSSSALAVNSFGPFRRYPERLSLLGFSGFVETQFECKCPMGLGGKAPNLDFLARCNVSVVGVESKFLEPLSAKTAKFADSYRRLVAEEADTVWQRAYDELKSKPKRFRHLDAAQLVKHSLGLRHTFPDVEKLVLLYLFWEPVEAGNHQEFIVHRQEITEFADWVRGGDVRFEAQGYPDLWRHWAEKPIWDGAAEHVSVLRDRYEFGI